MGMTAQLSDDPPPLLSQLRAATRAQHASLDASVGGDVTASRESYTRFLTASRLAVRAVERGIEAQLGAEFEASRERLLDADLGSAETSPAEPLPIHDEAEAWGAAYVVEGSALGGLVLADRARAALGPSAPTAYLSFRGKGAGTSSRWKWFQGELAAFAARSDAAAHARAVATARAVFDLYARAFASVK